MTALGPLNEPPRNVTPPFAVRPETFPSDLIQRAALLEALADVELGENDRRIIDWLARWDVATVGTVVSLLMRTRAAGTQEASGE